MCVDMSFGWIYVSVTQCNKWLWILRYILLAFFFLLHLFIFVPGSIKISTIKRKEDHHFIGTQGLWSWMQMKLHLLLLPINIKKTLKAKSLSTQVHHFWRYSSRHLELNCYKAMCGNFFMMLWYSPTRWYLGMCLWILFFSFVWCLMYCQNRYIYS